MAAGALARPLRPRRKLQDIPAPCTPTRACRGTGRRYILKLATRSKRPRESSSRHEALLSDLVARHEEELGGLRHMSNAKVCRRRTDEYDCVTAPVGRGAHT